MTDRSGQYTGDLDTPHRRGEFCIRDSTPFFLKVSFSLYDNGVLTLGKTDGGTSTREELFD